MLCPSPDVRLQKVFFFSFLMHVITSFLAPVVMLHLSWNGGVDAVNRYHVPTMMDLLMCLATGPGLAELLETLSPLLSCWQTLWNCMTLILHQSCRWSTGSMITELTVHDVLVGVNPGRAPKKLLQASMTKACGQLR